MEDQSETGKKNYVNFKKVVWHDAFRQLMKTLSGPSKTGCWFKCGDGVVRRLFPFVLALSADYEEQYALFSDIHT